MLFENLRYRIKEAVVKTMFYIRLYTQEEIEEIQRRRQAELEAKLAAHRQAQQQKETGVAAPIKRTTAKVGRNDPCPCGSGKKYKHCHGA